MKYSLITCLALCLWGCGSQPQSAFMSPIDQSGLVGLKVQINHEPVANNGESSIPKAEILRLDGEFESTKNLFAVGGAIKDGTVGLSGGALATKERPFPSLLCLFRQTQSSAPGFKLHFGGQLKVHVLEGGKIVQFSGEISTPSTPGLYEITLGMQAATLGDSGEPDSIKIPKTCIWRASATVD